MTDASTINASRWLHILAASDEQSRWMHAARLAEKAWLQGDRVAVLCDDAAQADAVDLAFWDFSPERFLPHSQFVADAGPPDPVSLLLTAPDPSQWETLIVLSRQLPDSAPHFQRLALVTHNQAEAIRISRAQFRQLRALGCEPRINDLRQRTL